jgi:hypothetical protein
MRCLQVMEQARRKTGSKAQEWAEVWEEATAPVPPGSVSVPGAGILFPTREEFRATRQSVLGADFP